MAGEDGSRTSEGSSRNDKPTRSLWILAALGLLSALLGAFLWRQLMVARAGGTPICGFGEEGACSALWDSAFASAVHARTGLPVAAWGLVWGMVALILPLLALDERGGRGARTAVRLTALGGLVATVGLAAVSVSDGIFCAGCVATYVLVLAYGLVTFFGLGPSLPSLGTGVSLALGATVVAWLLFLYPGTQTPQAEGYALERAMTRTAPVTTPVQEEPSEPRASVGEAAPVPPPAAEDEGGSEGPASPEAEGVEAQLNRAIWDFVLELDAPSQQMLADALYVYTHSPIIPVREPRLILGPEDAPVRLTDFTDVRCPACADLHSNLKIFEQAVPPGTFNLEPRHFPLDGRCNPLIPQERPEAIRCQAAKALICLEPSGETAQLQSELFANQEQLDERMLFQLASSYMPEADLRECMESPETASKLGNDIAWAQAHHIRGTPLVLLNGRKGSSFGPFLYVMLLNEGRADHPAFEQLPPPSERVTAPAR